MQGRLSSRDRSFFQANVEQWIAWGLGRFCRFGVRPLLTQFLSLHGFEHKKIELNRLEMKLMIMIFWYKNEFQTKEATNLLESEPKVWLQLKHFPHLELCFRFRFETWLDFVIDERASNIRKYFMTFYVMMKEATDTYQSVTRI